MGKPFNRRDFLYTVVAGAGSLTVGGLSGCSDDGGGPERPRVTPFAELSLVEGGGFFPQSVASGDPGPDRLIFWTRLAPELAGQGLNRVRFAVATDRSFADPLLDTFLETNAERDNCVKVRVTNLPAASDIFYRFVFEADDGRLHATPLGRGRTAPSPDDDRSVRFAVASCQDFTGRFYNMYLALLEEDLDFLVHVGDYVYETTGDPEFQETAGERRVTFDDTAGAIRLGSDERPFFAAASLDNYRQLYRSYRSDPVLQAVHERFPLVAIWDDHEFSNDSWQDHGTYFDGRRNEQDRERKRNAERAYFEYMPLAAEREERGALQPGPEHLFPATRAYRELIYGANLHLLLTDTRSFRPDHLIPEDGFPGTVVVGEDELRTVLSAQGVDLAERRDQFTPYIDIDAAAFDGLRPALIEAQRAAYRDAGVGDAEAGERAEAVIQGRLAVNVVNALIEAHNAADDGEPLSPIAIEDDLPVGIAFTTLGKTGLFGSIGARNFVVKDSYDLYAAHLQATRGSGSQDVFGQDQSSWLRTALMNSPTRWRVLASSVSFTSMIIDLSDPELGVPAPFNQRFYLSVDQWDGFPDRRAALFDELLAPIGGTLLVSGDIHASFATDHGRGIAELTASSISSATQQELIARAIENDPTLSGIPAAELLLAFIDSLFLQANPGIKHARTARHGTVVVDVTSEAITGTLLEIDRDDVFTRFYDEPQRLLDRVRRTPFRFDGQALAREDGSR